jgi:serine/threonine protein kinase
MDTAARGYLVQVFEVGIAQDLDRRGYMVTEFVRGEDLRRRFASFEGAIPENQVEKWMRELTAALAALHKMTPPLLHRDLKPDNVLLGMDSHVRLIDFGLAARIVKEGTAPGHAGTFSYMAPETLKGESVQASDVYSVGVMMYEALTGGLPFSDIEVSPGCPAALQGDVIYSKKRNLLAPSPRSTNPLISSRVDHIVQTCLAFKAADRYVDAAALHAALSQSAVPDPCDGWREADSRADEMLKRGALADARALVEDALAGLRQRRPPPAEPLFNLLRKLAEIAETQQDFRQAAEALKEAWDLAKTTSVLPNPRKRLLLVEKTSRAFATAGNPLFSRRYAGEADELRGRLPGR